MWCLEAEIMFKGTLKLLPPQNSACIRAKRDKEQGPTDGCSVDCCITEVLWTSSNLVGWNMIRWLFYNQVLRGRSWFLQQFWAMKPVVSDYSGCVTGPQCVTVCSTWRSPHRAVQTKQELCSPLWGCGGVWGINMPVCLCVVWRLMVLEMLLV